MVRGFFVNAHGRLRSGWWVAVFLLLLLACLAPLIALAGQRQQGVPVWQQALAVLVASVVCQLLRRRPIGELLGPLDRRWLRGLAAGATLGFALMAVPAAGLAALGVVTFEWNPPDSAALSSLAAVFVAVAVTEELMFRGFAFQRLIDGLGVWPAQVIGAGFFLLTHADALRDAGTVGVPGAVNIFVASLMFGFAYLRTHSLAMPIGLHVAANMTQGALLGFGVSGNGTQGWLAPVLNGPQWLTGGPFGLEASVPGLLSVVVLTAILRPGGRVHSLRVFGSGLVAIVLGLCTVAVAPAAAQPRAAAARTKIDVSKLGPQVGQTVPDFRLQDQNGKVWTRSSIMGPKGALLLFYRSADWCPYCKTQLIDLQSRLGELRARGLGVAAISYDPVPTLAEFASRKQVTFPLLSDAGSATIKAFGILNPMPEMAFGPDKDDPAVVAELQKYVSGGRTNPSWVGIAFPGTFILDAQGKVVSRFFEDYYVERATFSNILLKLGADAAPVSATRIGGTHVDLTGYSSDANIAAGNRFSLAVQVTPHAGVHVYAPGASGYRVVGLTLEPQPFVRVLPAAYPPSEIYFFKPLNERVPVFQKPFTLVQELVLEGTAAAQAALKGRNALTIRGTLDYQACDDKVCFNPVSIPVTWTLSLKALVTERAPQRQP